MINQRQCEQQTSGFTGSNITNGLLLIILILLFIFGSTNIDKLLIAPGGA